MNNKDPSISILCSVVDNYGDIGFVYRLARNLSQKNKDLKLTLIVSNLKSFAAMAPEIDPSKEIQTYNGCTVLDWNADRQCTSYFIQNPLEVVLQCFQCGRPQWMEELLFAKDRADTVQIINIEYLTAEQWADDFHLLRSGTRSSYVKKINFMPGFTPKTGGLILDEPFMSYLKDSTIALKEADFYTKEEDTFDVVLFSYPRNFDSVIKALKDFQAIKQKSNPSFRIRIYAANGISLNCVIESCLKYHNPFELIKLPYLTQTQWDALLTLTDFNFIRGEDSFARACLTGKPFIWHAYPQEEEVQIIKVKAFLDRLEPYMDSDMSRILNLFTLSYNRKYKIPPCTESYDILCKYPEIEEEKDNSKLLVELFVNYDILKSCYKNFARDLIRNGNLTDNLLSYIKTLY